jgi:hypothetical protein
MLNQLMGRADKHAERMLDYGSESYLNGERFSPPCSSIVDTSSIGWGVMPEIVSIFRSLAIMTVDEYLINSIEEDVLLVCFCCIIDFPPSRFACDPGSSNGGVSTLWPHVHVEFSGLV